MPLRGALDRLTTMVRYLPRRVDGFNTSVAFATEKKSSYYGGRLDHVSAPRLTGVVYGLAKTRLPFPPSSLRFHVRPVDSRPLASGTVSNAVEPHGDLG